MPEWLSRATTGIIPILIIAVVGTAIYSNTFDSSFHFDDETSIVTNKSIQDLSDIRAIWAHSPTRFITYWSFALNYHFHKQNVFGYHLVNLLIHLGSAFLTWWLIILTLSTPAIRDHAIIRHARTLALFAGLLFAAHPVQTQAVTYIVQRAAALATFFYLASLSLYVKARLVQLKEAKRGVTFGLFAASVAAAALGMFTKEIAFSLPLLILLYEFYFLRGEGKVRLRYLSILLVILLLIPLMLLVSNLVPLADTTSISRTQYLLTEFRVHATYLRLLILPIRQNLDYDYPLSRSMLELSTLSSFLLMITMIVIGIRMFSRNRLISFGIFWFLLTLLPESSIVPIRDVINEHRLYLPMFGYSLFLVTLTHSLLENRSPLLWIAVPLLVITLYSVSAYERNKVWKDELTLWNDVIEKSPSIARAYNNRGNTYLKNGDYVRALFDFDQALRVDPRFGDAYGNRANVYFNRGEYDKAISDYSQALALGLNYVGNLAVVYYNRGIAYLNKGVLDKAMDDFNKSLSIDAFYPGAYNNRGAIYSNTGEYDKAIADFNSALTIDPGSSEAYNNRGLTYYRKGEYGYAISDFEKALRISPLYAQPYFNRAQAYYASGNHTKALEDIRRVQSLGYQVDPAFLEILRKSSAR